METVNRAEPQKESTIKDFLEVIFRRRAVVLIIVATVTVIVIILTLRQPAVYESSGKVLVKRGEPTGVFERGIRTLSWEEEIASQIEMVKSQPVVERAQKILPDVLPEGYEAKQRILAGRINSGVVSTSNVIWITYISENRVFCKAAVDAVIRAYRDYYSDMRTPPQMEDFFISEIQRLGQEVDYWRSRKEQAMQEWKIVDLVDQRRNFLNRLAGYEAELDEATRDRVAREAAIASLERIDSSAVDDLSIISSGISDASVVEGISQSLRLDLHKLRMREAELQSKYTDQNAELVQVREQIVSVRRMISEEIRTQVRVLRRQRDLLREQEEALKRLIAVLGDNQEAYPRISMELEWIQSSLDRTDKAYKDIQDQYLSSRIAIASNPEWTVTILSPASDGYRKKTRDYVRMALGPVFSIIVAIGLAFFIDNLDHSIKSISEAEEILGLSVLANFPESRRE